MKFTRHKNERGFTLVEILVVLVIAAVILTAVMKIFTRSQVIYNVQEEVAAMQQNVRTAKMFLERDIRMTGSGVMNLSGPNQASILPLWFDNSATGADRLTVRYEMPSDNSCGDTPKAPATMLCSDLPPLTLAGQVSTTATVADVTQDLNVAPHNAWDNGVCSCGETVYNLASDNMPFVVSTPDKSISSVLVFTGANAGGGTDKIANGPNVSHGSIPSPGNDELYDFIDENTSNTLPNKQLNTFPAGSLITFFSPGEMYEAIYYIATDATTGITSLYRDTDKDNVDDGEIIAEHIEDFQCAFVMEDDSVIWDRDLTTAEIADVRMVRIGILGRSAHPHRQSGGEFSGKRPLLEDHPEAATDDNFRRRLLTVTVKVRNFELN